MANIITTLSLEMSANWYVSKKLSGVGRVGENTVTKLIIEPTEILENVTYELEIMSADGTKNVAELTVDGDVLYLILTANMLTVGGITKMQVRAVFEDNSIKKSNIFELKVSRSISATDYYEEYAVTVFDQLVSQCQEIIDGAEGYVERAETAAENAEDYSESASASASSASASATTASASATTAVSASETATAASTSATASAETATTAAASASTSATTATNASETAVNASTSASASAGTAVNASASAATSASSAEASATNAATSEANASASATAASTSASNAATSETNARNSATAAHTSEVNAATSENNASTYATNAYNSAQNAATSATNAHTSETNASASATAANTSATNAHTSETNAANSATAASNSATAAGNSATAANTSAVNAHNSEVAAGTSETNAGNSATEAAASAASVSASVAQINENTYRINDLEAIIGGYTLADLPTGAMATVTDGTALLMPSLEIGIEPIQSGSGDPSPDNIRPISGWTAANVIVSPTTTASDGTTYNVQFIDGDNPLTVYGGTLDVTTGELVVDMKSINLGNLTWYYTSEQFRANISDAKLVLDSQTIPNAKCSIYTPTSWNNMWNMKFTMVWSSVKGINVIDNRFTDPTLYKTAMNGVQLVYELTTPTTYQLTPTQIRTLVGNNNIWADTGNIIEGKYYKSPS